MPILEIVVWIVGVVWIFPWAVSLLYALVLWLTKDIQYEGYILWRRVFPALRFRLVPTRGWLARLWAGIYGQALFLIIVHKDMPGTYDDRLVERVIVHEMRHVHQQMLLGIFQWLIYGLHSAYLAIFTEKNPYKDNVFERDARAAAGDWVMQGRPRIFDFGPRQ